MTKKLSLLTKQDEIEMLRKFSDDLPKDSYLASLFTPEMMEWAEGRIKNDFPPDIFDALKDAMADKGNETAKLIDAQARLSKADAAFQAMHESLTSTIREQQETINVKNTAINDLNARIDDLLCQEKSDQAHIASQEASIQQQQQEIIRLKAEIYDLTHKA